MNRKCIFFAIFSACILLLAGCFGSGTATWDFEGSKGYRVVDGNGYYFNKAGTKAFLNDFAWDLSDGFVLDLPEEADGADIFGIGGFFGTGVPVRAEPRVDSGLVDTETWYEKALEEYGDSLEVQSPTIRVVVGKKITGVVRLYSTFVLLKEESEDGHRIALSPSYYFECSEDNLKYYAKDGHLYYKTGEHKDEDVKPGPYWDEEGE